MSYIKNLNRGQLKIKPNQKLPIIFLFKGKLVGIYFPDKLSSSLPKTNKFFPSSDTTLMSCYCFFHNLEFVCSLTSSNSSYKNSLELFFFRNNLKVHCNIDKQCVNIYD